MKPLTRKKQKTEAGKGEERRNKVKTTNKKTNWNKQRMMAQAKPKKQQQNRREGKPRNTES